jgi:hypothetical protein
MPFLFVWCQHVRGTVFPLTKIWQITSISVDTSLDIALHWRFNTLHTTWPLPMASDESGKQCLWSKSINVHTSICLVDPNKTTNKPQGATLALKVQVGRFRTRNRSPIHHQTAEVHDYFLWDDYKCSPQVSNRHGDQTFSRVKELKNQYNYHSPGHCPETLTLFRTWRYGDRS